MIPKPKGPAPAPQSKRRRANKPVSYGAAEPIVVGVAAKQPTLGFKGHKMVADMWRALGKSVEGQFFSDADWQRAKWEMWYANELFTGVRQLTPVAWNAVQSGLSELLVSAADKRRAGIELRRVAADPDEAAAVDQIAEYKSRIAG